MQPFPPSPVRSHPQWGMWALVLVVALGAAAGITGGATVASRGVLGAASAAPGPFGHLRDADPCTLLQADRLRTFGETTLYPDFGIVAGCDAQVRVGGSGLVGVRLALETPTVAQVGGEPTTVGDLTVRRRVSVFAGSCSHQIITADGSRVEVTADGPPSGGSVCPMADVVVDGAVEVLSSGGVGRRDVSGPPNSLLDKDICALVEPADLAVVPGVDPNRREVGYGGWSCRFGLTPGQQTAPFAQLWTEFLGTRGVTDVITVAGRVVGTYPAQTGAACSLSVQQRVFVGSTGNRRTEALSVYVWGGRGADHAAACQSAQRLVERLVPKLPPI
ncbi:hypothetical protein WEH80_06225 [Actinomycetes bacterium KLBMP 9759]